MSMNGMNSVFVRQGLIRTILFFFGIVTLRGKLVIEVAILLLVLTKSGTAQTWAPTVADPTYRWSNPSNWSGGVPTPASSVTINVATVCTLDVNPTIANLTFSAGNLDLNGHPLVITGGSVTAFTNGSITNSGSVTSISVSNSGSTTVTGTIFNAGVDVMSPDIQLTGATFNEASTFKRTGSSAGSWNGGNIFNKATIINNLGTGTLQFPTTTADTFNSDLTLTQTSGAISSCVTGNCKVGGNLLVNGTIGGTYTFGTGAAGGALEFIGGNAQTFNIGGSLTALQVAKIILNKSGSQTITPNTLLTVVTSATFTKGIIATSNTVAFALGATHSGASNSSFVDGNVSCAAGIATFTFPTGNINVCHPLTLTPVPNFLGYVRYFKGDMSSNVGFTLAAGITNVSSVEYWYVAAHGTAGGQKTKVTLSWVNADYGNPSYVTNTAALLVARLDPVPSPNNWVNIGNSAINTFPPYTLPSGGTITSGLYAMSTFENIGYVTLGSTNLAQNPLPIELAKFSERSMPEGIRLNWETLSEINNNLFEIERSSNGLDFVKIGEVDGHGTTTQVHEYSWIDREPPSGLSYYRLRQVDFDEVSTYSNVISVSNFADQDRDQISFYPNPASDKLFLSRKSDVKIIDVLGNVVFTGHGVNEINIEALKPGVYCIMIPSGDACRFVKN